MSLDKEALIRLFNKMVALKDELRWGSKKKLETALKEWQREDRMRYTLIREVMVDLEDIEES